EYLDILPADAQLLVDDAHGAGVLGKTGKGSPEHAGVRRERVIQTITLSKAFGTFGGTILCTPALRNRIISRSELFAGTTPLPWPVAEAARQACRLLRAGRKLSERLSDNSERIKEKLRAAGLSLPHTPGPIVALTPRDARIRTRLERALFAAGIYPSFIKYP